MAFPGFPDGEVTLTPIPATFFTDILPAIDHLGELKITLYAFWQLNRKEGTFHYLRYADFSQDEQLMASMGATQQEVEAQLSQSIDRAVKRGSLLRVPVTLEQEDFLYFLNSPKGRAAVQAIERGEWRPTGDELIPVEVLPESANIFRLYEENIGPLTPMIADTLRDAEESYPDQWIEEAVRLAVENNARTWRYVEAILSRWQEKGKDERKDRRDTEKARRRYAEWEDSE
jgi:DnaD/phage-associated family protein